jgi:hypothetical protein
MSSLRAIAHVFLITGSVATSAFAGGATWVPTSLLAPAPKGTPAEVVFDAAASSASISHVEVRIHGFWVEDVSTPFGTFQRIEVPGLPRLGEIGKPDLPVLRAPLALPALATSARLVATTVLASKEYDGILAAPTPVPRLDDPVDPAADPGPGDPDGVPEEWKVDPAVYGGVALFPAGQPLAPVSATTRYGSISSATPHAHVAWFDPVKKSTIVDSRVRFQFEHIGTIPPFQSLTPDRIALAKATFLNFEEAIWLKADVATYRVRYAIVTPPQYVATLEPLIERRKSFGFEVDVLRTDVIGTACEAIRAALASWYSAGNAQYDHYALLVGDVLELPQCPMPSGGSGLSDDPYASPAGIPDVDDEIIVGRLSVDSKHDLAAQIAKILAYETSPPPVDHGKALLVAHDDPAPGYVATMDEIAAATYSHPPSFAQIAGSAPGATNESITTAMEAGVGIVAYRGHGTAYAWPDWNGANDDFHKNDVVLLANGGRRPVVWSFSCSNSDLAAGGLFADSIGENWLEATGGAVAHYGASRPVPTLENDALAKSLFDAVFDHGITVHGQAIAYAESAAADQVPGHAGGAYVLLGDGSVRLRRGVPKTLKILAPAEYSCGGPNPACVMQLQVVDAQNVPQPGILVSVWKGPPAVDPDGPDEISFTGYTDGQGNVNVPTGPISLGTIHTIGRDPEGDVAITITPTVVGPFKDLGGAKAGTLGKPKLVGEGTAQPMTPVTIRLLAAAPNATAVLFIALADNPTPFLGGTFHPLPLAFSSVLATNFEGAIALDVPAWPAAIPSDTLLVFQYAVADPDALGGVSLSNGLRLLVP